MEDADEFALYGSWSRNNPQRPGPFRWWRRFSARVMHHWDWSPLSPYFWFRSARMWWLQRHKRRAAMFTYTALKILYNETADYITINKLGDVHHNLSMKAARDALAMAQHTQRSDKAEG